MRTYPDPIATLDVTPQQSRRDSISSIREDTPYSPYLRNWFKRQVSRHRDLLLNIDAAERIGLASALVG